MLAQADVTPGTVWPPDFGALTRATERRLVQALALEPIALPAELARMDGEWQGQPVIAEARRYRGQGVRFARVATVEGAGLSIGNVLVIPDAASTAPILGGDLVWVGTRPHVAMIACDLSPTLDDYGGRAAQIAAVAAAVPSVTTVPSGGALPAWCEAIFSLNPLYTRFGEDDAMAAQGVFDAYVEAFVSVMNQSAGAAARDMAPGLALRGIENYCFRHREDDRGLLLLERLFGKVRATRYLDEVLFPISIDGCAT